MKYIRYGLLMLATLVLLWFAFRQVDLGLLYRQIVTCDAPYLVAAVLATAIVVWSRVVRWRLLLRSAVATPLPEIARAFLIGILANTVTPMRLGDLLRAYLLGRGTGLSKASVLASIVVEKVIDVALMALVLGATLLWSPMPTDLRLPVLSMGLLGVALLGILVVGGSREEWILARVDWLRRWRWTAQRTRLLQMLEYAISGLSVLRERKRLPQLLMWSLLSWGVSGAINALVLVALNVPVPLSAAILVLVVTNLGMALPSPLPGYIGQYQWLVWLALAPYGVETSTALAYGIVLHVISFGPVALGGIACLWGGRWRMSDLQRAALTG